MTRTERATFPRALVRDRSESKSGLDKSLRKGGNGHHNWGSLANETYHETAFEDETEDLAEDGNKKGVEKPETPMVERRSNSLTEEERQLARNFRKNALKGREIDLSAIARTSHAVSVSPPRRVTVTLGAETCTLGSRSISTLNHAIHV
ncbi:hypothetical protein PAXRUDRAFT_833455 [Paxillus rubicundulus Ve08.2h10]|uniref:Hyaluronan/mRNA-binding protein domain-containing protein n=1 Tax=Paxillus rubicundulus Ve08.2h10 TaxID=930991 RepID=A0A0D0DGW2_9AGAM|nr:hypothetical protein PAXRUDRAFT_833455 [Paxillus rubicundulus Ve08.2h10]